MLAESGVMNVTETRTVRTHTGQIHMMTVSRLNGNRAQLLCGQPFDVQYDLLHPSQHADEMCPGCAFMKALSAS